MGPEIARVLIALGSVAASVGLVVYGMGLAFYEPRDFEINLGIGLMIGGLIAFIIGVIVYRATDRPVPDLMPRDERRGP